MRLPRPSARPCSAAVASTGTPSCVSRFEPTTPAWYAVTLDRRTLQTLDVRMTAAG
jgi:hypothetical protein